MLSAVIRNGHSYRAVPLAGQLVHHRSAHPGPLVLGATPLNSPARTLDRDRTVSQRSEPSSRTALMGEQPNPWEVLPPQDATSRHRAISAVTGGADYLSTVLFRATGRRLIAAIDSPPRRQNRYLTTLFRTDQSLQGHIAMLIALRRTSHGVVLDRFRDRAESTVISRCVNGVSAISPHLSLRCQTTPSL